MERRNAKWTYLKVVIFFVKGKFGTMGMRGAKLKSKDAEEWSETCRRRGVNKRERAREGVGSLKQRISSLNDPKTFYPYDNRQLISRYLFTN